jgi:uncharacterized protein
VYLFNELLYLSPFIIYACWRALRLAARRPSRVFLAALFLVLAAAYPLAETFSHAAVPRGARLAVLAGYCALPFWLYYVLAVFVSDLGIFLCRRLKILSPEAAARPGFRKARLGLLFAVPAAVVAAGVVNYGHLRVREYAIEISGKSSSAERLNIVFMADLHLGPFTERGFPEKLVAAVNGFDPDVILIGGDILEGDRRGEQTGEFERTLGRLRARLGVYAVPGNHEGHRRDTEGFFARAGIHFLKDAVVRVDDAFSLAGRDDARGGRRKALPDLLSSAAGDLPVLVLDHRPVDLAGASRAMVDIQFSGHTHHGQLFPINFLTKRRYGLSWGHRQLGRTHIFVTSGVGLWGPPVRTVGASEILLVRVLLGRSPASDKPIRDQDRGRAWSGRSSLGASAK